MKILALLVVMGALMVTSTASASVTRIYTSGPPCSWVSPYEGGGDRWYYSPSMGVDYIYQYGVYYQGYYYFMWIYAVRGHGGTYNGTQWAVSSGC